MMDSLLQRLEVRLTGDVSLFPGIFLSCSECRQYQYRCAYYTAGIRAGGVPSTDPSPHRRGWKNAPRDIPEGVLHALSSLVMLLSFRRASSSVSACCGFSAAGLINQLMITLLRGASGIRLRALLRQRSQEASLRCNRRSVCHRLSSASVLPESELQ